MEKDPGEMINLVYKKKFLSVLKEHRKLMAEWAIETNDTEFPYYNE